MAKNRPFRLHFLLFLLVSAIGFTQLGWWIIYQVREGVRLIHQQESLWEQQTSIAQQWIATHTDSVDMTRQWLSQTFPDLVVAENGQIEIAAIARQRLDHTAARRVRMFVWEGGFFTLLMLTGMAFVYWTLRKEVEFERRQSTFLAATSHELKTPIASLRLFVDTLEDRQLTAEQRAETFAIMRSDLERLSDLIERLLQAQVLMDDKRRLDLQPTDLAEETQIAIEQMQTTFALRRITLTSELNSGLFAMTEPQRWQLLVKNLLDNAQKYSPEGGEIAVILICRGKSARLKVSDHGIGLEKAELERIFERFYRVGQEEIRQTQGTGLGLYLVRRIAESFHGRAWAESQGKGHGTDFFVEIPLTEWCSHG